MRKPSKYAVVAATAVYSMSCFACATTTPVTDIRTTPRDREIQVVTVGGNIHYFKNWGIDKDSAIVSFSDDSRGFPTVMRRYHILPVDSIRSVALVDRTNETIGKTSVMVIGITAGLAVLWLMVKSVSVLAGFSAH